MIRILVCTGLLAASLCARAQSYPTMASAPDPADFASRADFRMTLAGDPFRFGGADLDWLGGVAAGAPGAPSRLPTTYEAEDGVLAVHAMGGTVIRAPSLVSSVDCPICLEVTRGRFNAAAFAALDHILHFAHDNGIRLILPLVGPLGADCAHTDPAEGARGDGCAYLARRGLRDRSAFFSDPGVRADVAAHAAALLDHVNAETGARYRDDPAILAWEDCDACAAGADPKTVRAWSDAFASFVKARDKRHLFETGAFAGHLDALLADPPKSDGPIDIVGDRLLDPNRTGSGEVAWTTAPKIGKAGFVYVVDAMGWNATYWKSLDELSASLSIGIQTPELTGALLWRLYAHADEGGLMPDFTRTGPDAFLFPGVGNGTVSWGDMRERARLFRRFSYIMAGVSTAPMFEAPPLPVIISVHAGRITWRGSAGAIAYDIQRSPDPGKDGSWETVCHSCGADPASTWQDPSPLKSRAWYRMTPFNMNNHAGAPSDPVQDSG